MKRATIRDIAASLGVSVMTVSRAIRNHPEINEKTKARILARAAELNYRPNPWARSLVTNRSNVIGLVIPDIAHAFFSEITSGVQEIAAAGGYNVFLCKSDRDPRIERAQIESLLDTRVHGLIIAPQQPESSPQFLQELLKHKIKFVLIDRDFPKVKCFSLTAGDEEVGRLAASHLIGLGHRRIAHVRGAKTSSARRRMAGFLEVLRANGLECRPEWIAEGRFSFDASREVVSALFRRPSRPTAIFAASDLTAFGAVAALRDMGLAVPGDVSVVGAGNIEGNQHPDPFLTTVEWDSREMGREAARVLLTMGGPDECPPSRIEFPPRLVSRRSARAIGC
ncbi:MAG: LacI family DNA-binding transcriptional regulator [Bryobacterales bacterium]|nr:LacI family DNA-binding transcriptional regulator [Bryobacterales bacterium]